MRKIKVPSHENMQLLSRIWIRFGSAVTQMKFFLKCCSENFTRNSKPKKDKDTIFFFTVLFLGAPRDRLGPQQCSIGYDFIVRAVI